MIFEIYLCSFVAKNNLLTKHVFFFFPSFIMNSKKKWICYQNETKFVLMRENKSTEKQKQKLNTLCAQNLKNENPLKTKSRLYDARYSILLERWTE